MVVAFSFLTVTAPPPGSHMAPFGALPFTTAVHASAGGDCVSALACAFSHVEAPASFPPAVPWVTVSSSPGDSFKFPHHAAAHSLPIVSRLSMCLLR